MMFHERIHVARVVPVVPGIFGIAVFAMVNAASVAAAIVASGRSLVGVGRNCSLSDLLPKNCTS